MKNPWMLPVVSLLLGTAVGWFSGRNAGGLESGDGEREPAVRTRSSVRHEPEKGGDSGKRVSRVAGTEQIVRLPGSSNRAQALMDYYSGLTPGQLEEEARKLENLPMNERIMASFLLFGRWGESDPTAAMAFAGTMGFTGMFVRPTILQSWASVDPASAARYYTANPREFSMMGMMGGGRGPMGGQGGASIIASEWAKQDPAGALAWASSLGSEKSQAMNSVVGEVAKSDPKKAAEMLGGADIPDKGSAYQMVAGHYGAADFAGAQAWIRSLPTEEQAGALAAAIGGLSNSDPQAAVAQVEKMEAGDARDRVVAEVVEDLARVDPQAAGTFLKKQESERALRESMRGLMPTWVAKDPQAALAYAQSFEPGGVRDSALQSYVWSNNSSAPQDLVKVAETIGDEGDRNRMIGLAAMRWMREDEAAAKSYIEQSTTLPEDAKQRILEGRGMWGGGGRGRRGGN